VVAAAAAEAEVVAAGEAAAAAAEAVAAAAAAAVVVRNIEVRHSIPNARPQWWCSTTGGDPDRGYGKSSLRLVVKGNGRSIARRRQ
jgi:hypothetical protein